MSLWNMARASQDYYGNVLSSSADLKTSACTASGKPHPAIQKALAAVPAEVLDKFYGCGAPLPLGITGLNVLDLGCGSGRDCYLAAALGAARVVGVDMTPVQLAVGALLTRRYLKESFDKHCGHTLRTLPSNGLVSDVSCDPREVDMIPEQTAVRHPPLAYGPRLFCDMQSILSLQVLPGSCAMRCIA